jgi:hypothetical protein
LYALTINYFHIYLYICMSIIMINIVSVTSENCFVLNKLEEGDGALPLFLSLFLQTLTVETRVEYHVVYIYLWQSFFYPSLKCKEGEMHTRRLSSTIFVVWTFLFLSFFLIVFLVVSSFFFVPLFHISKQKRLLFNFQSKA